MDAHLVFQTTDIDRLIRLHQEQREAAGIFAVRFGAGQHQQDLGAAVGDEPFDAVQEPPLALCPCGGCALRFSAQGGAGLHRSQVRTGIRLSQHHRGGHLAACKTGQEPGLHFLAAEHLNRSSDLLQPENGHQPGFGTADDFDHHPVN